MGKLDATQTVDEQQDSGPSTTRTVPTVTLVYGPLPAGQRPEGVERLGERAYPAKRSILLSRSEPGFAGGPLDDAEVSRSHAEVAPAPEGAVVVRDVGSKNGTFVNGVRVGRDPFALADGDVIQVGRTLLLFHHTVYPPPPDAAVPEFVGTSDAARRVRSATVLYAPQPAPALILGETGTGKEAVAAALARMGRPGRPYVTLNAAATAATLLEATLFGHVRGAFTDAKEARPGAFRSAHTGTLFLDEIGELPLDAQVKLLRVIEEQRVTPVGATQSVPVDFRLVSATNRDLVAEVAAGHFRSDLFARIAYLTIPIPPLRARREDIPRLALHFAGGRAFTCAAVQRLLEHAWPFNVRELKAVVEQTRVECAAGDLLDLPASVLARLGRHSELALGAAADPPGRTPPARLDRAAVEAALARAEGNMARAAAALGKDRSQLYRIVKRFGLDPNAWRADDAGR